MAGIREEPIPNLLEPEIGQPVGSGDGTAWIGWTSMFEVSLAICSENLHNYLGAYEQDSAFSPGRPEEAAGPTPK